MTRIVPRGFTACADAYLTPHIKDYLEVRVMLFRDYRIQEISRATNETFFQSFSAGFKNNLKDVNVLFMQSDGGLTPMNS